MDSNDNKVFEYVKKTKLTDDFRRLKDETPTSEIPQIQGNNCVICLDEFDEPRTLPCQHKFCRVCLQYAIDNTPTDSDSDRGFECILCGHFVKVLNYSIPRSEWADNVPDTKLLSNRVRAHVRFDLQAEVKGQDSEEKGKSETEAYRWFLDWKVSTYSKSFCIDNGIDPCERTKHGFKLTGNIGRTDTNGADVNDNLFESRNTTKGDFEVYNGADKFRKSRSCRKSCIISAVYYKDNIVVYDEGLCEVLLYKNDLTLRSSTRQTNIFDIAVLETDLFMTNPEERCVQILDLENFRRKDPVDLTLKCFGISSLGDQLAVLLCDNSDQNFHISFLNSKGIIGGTIHLKSSAGSINFVVPRHLAVCPLTRLVFVSDSKIGAVKSFHLDGHLKWERLAYDAGYLAMYNGYLISARKFTSSLDVLSGGGIFAGRLESAVYGIEAPSVVAVRDAETEIVVVDKDNMLHTFNIRKELDIQTSNDSCSSCVLV